MTWSTRKQSKRRTNSVRGHDHFDVLRGLKTIELIEQLEHRPLYFRISTPAPALASRTADRVDLVHEDDARRMLTGHDEKFPDHSRAFSNILLHELATRDTNESTIGVMSNRARQKSFAGTRRAVQENTLRLGNSERFKQLRVLDWEFDDLLNFLDLLVEASDHVVCTVRHLLDHHQRNERIHFVWQDFMDLVRIRPKGDAQSWSDGGNIDVGVKVDD